MMPVNKCNWQILAAQHVSNAQKLPNFSHSSPAFGIFIKNEAIFQNPFKTESSHSEISFKTPSNERPVGEEDFSMKSAPSGVKVEKVPGGFFAFPSVFLSNSDTRWSVRLRH